MKNCKFYLILRYIINYVANIIYTLTETFEILESFYGKIPKKHTSSHCVPTAIQEILTELSSFLILTTLSAFLNCRESVDLSMCVAHFLYCLSPLQTTGS